MTDKQLVDSNILVYIVDAGDADKHSRAIEWMEKLGNNEVFVSAQNLREFAKNCIKKSIIPPERIIEYIDSFAARFFVVQDDFTDTKVAVALSRGSHKLFYDANIVSVMKRKGIGIILTEDTKDFQSLGVKAINPLK